MAITTDRNNIKRKRVIGMVVFLCLFSAASTFILLCWFYFASKNSTAYNCIGSDFFRVALSISSSGFTAGNFTNIPSLVSHLAQTLISSPFFTVPIITSRCLSLQRCYVFLARFFMTAYTPTAMSIFLVFIFVKFRQFFSLFTFRALFCFSHILIIY